MLDLCFCADKPKSADKLMIYLILIAVHANGSSACDRLLMH